MRKWVIAGAVVLALCAIIIVALLNLNTLVNRNKDYLVEQAQRALGRKVSVGEVGVTLWGGIGVKLNDFALAEDKSFGSGEFVRAEDLQVNVKLLPLMRGELQVKRLILHDPVIGIIRNRGGEYNFSTIGKQAKAKEKAPPEAEAEAPRRAVPALLVSLVDISGGEIRYLDRKDGIDIGVKQIDLRVKDLDFNRPFSVELGAALLSEKQNVKARTRIGPLPADGDLSRVPLEGEIDIDPIHFTQLRAAAPKLTAALPKDLALSGVFRVKDLKLKGTLKKLAVNGTLEGTDGSITFGKTLHKSAGTPLRVFADADYAGGALSLHQTKVKLHNLELGGKGNVSLGNVVALNLSVDSNRFSLEGWGKIFPLIQEFQLSGNVEVKATIQGKLGKGATPGIRGGLVLSGVGAKPAGLPKAIRDLNATVSFTGRKADLKETTLSVGNTRLRMAAEIERFSPLVVSYKLSAAEFWPADFQASVPEDRKSDVMGNLSSVGQLSAGNGAIGFQGGLSSGQGSLYKIPYKDLGASVVLDNDMARIRNLRVKALDGSVQAEGEYSFKASAPRFSVAGKVQGLDLKELYRALDARGERDIQGRLNAEVKLSGKGKSWKEIKPSLQGQGETEVLQGALLNFNLAEGVLSAVTGIPGLPSLINPQVRQKYPETFEARDTEFKELRGLFSVGDSRLNLKSLRITAADYTVQGSGWVDFDRRVDLHSVLAFSPRLSADLARSAREVSYMFNEQNQFEIPFALSGTLPRVKPRPDSGYLAKMIQRGIVRRGAEELERRLFGTRESKPPAEPAPSEEQKRRERTPTEELIRRGLEGLFGR